LKNECIAFKICKIREVSHLLVVQVFKLHDIGDSGAYVFLYRVHIRLYSFQSIFISFTNAWVPTTGSNDYYLLCRSLSALYSESLIDGKVKMDIYDLGGGKNIRKIWERYYAEVCMPSLPSFSEHSWKNLSDMISLDSRSVILISYCISQTWGSRLHALTLPATVQVHGAVYVIDAADKGRLTEAMDELHSMLKEAHMTGKPVLIFANKQVCSHLVHW
jgi:hypothetical protein